MEHTIFRTTSYSWIFSVSCAPNPIAFIPLPTSYCAMPLCFIFCLPSYCLPIHFKTIIYRIFLNNFRNVKAPNAHLWKRKHSCHVRVGLSLCHNSQNENKNNYIIIFLYAVGAMTTRARLWHEVFHLMLELRIVFIRHWKWISSYDLLTVPYGWGLWCSDCFRTTN